MGLSELRMSRRGAPILRPRSKRRSLAALRKTDTGVDPFRYSDRPTVGISVASVPGKGFGEEALYTSETGGSEYKGPLWITGPHTITGRAERILRGRGVA